MEDDLAATEQRVLLCSHDQDALLSRVTELEQSIAEASEFVNLLADDQALAAPIGS